MNGFKPNIYPVMYWALAYGAIAGVLLFVVYLLSQYITVIWFPVFLAGLVFGGFRNYRAQREAFEKGQGIAPTNRPIMDEFREAVTDIASASQEMMAEQAAEDEAIAQQQAEEAQLLEQEQQYAEPTPTDEQQQPPSPPIPPTPPVQQ